MCELFGISANKKILLNTALKEFFSHSEEHPHGWGMAILDNNISIEKEPEKASRSKYLKYRLEVPVNSSRLFAHIRKATIGELNFNNCHPFVKSDDSGRKWTLAHNGTIFNSEILAEYQSLQEGNTDSERVLLYIIDKINEKLKENNGCLENEVRIEFVEKLIKKLAKGNKLNLLIYDEEYMYVHKNQEGTLYLKNNEDYTMFSTRPLDSDTWKNVPINRLMVYKDGKNIYTGKKHNHTYVFDEEHYKFLFVHYSTL